MSVEAGTPAPSSDTPADVSSRTSVAPIETAPSEDLMVESEELRRRRHRRRRTVADLPPSQKRFRLMLLGLVVLALVAAGIGKEMRPALNGAVRNVTHALPFQHVKSFLRPELLLLLAAGFIMLVLLFPDLEEKVLVLLGFQKPRRRGGSRHRSRSSRR